MNKASCQQWLQQQDWRHYFTLTVLHQAQTKARASQWQNLQIVAIDNEYRITFYWEGTTEISEIAFFQQKNSVVWQLVADCCCGDSYCWHTAAVLFWLGKRDNFSSVLTGKINSSVQQVLKRKSMQNHRDVMQKKQPTKNGSKVVVQLLYQSHHKQILVLCYYRQLSAEQWLVLPSDQQILQQQLQSTLPPKDKALYAELADVRQQLFAAGCIEQRKPLIAGEDIVSCWLPNPRKHPITSSFWQRFLQDDWQRWQQQGWICVKQSNSEPQAVLHFSSLQGSFHLLAKNWVSYQGNFTVAGKQINITVLFKYLLQVNFLQQTLHSQEEDTFPVLLEESFAIRIPVGVFRYLLQLLQSLFYEDFVATGEMQMSTLAASQWQQAIIKSCQHKERPVMPTMIEQIADYLMPMQKHSHEITNLAKKKYGAITLHPYQQRGVAWVLYLMQQQWHGIIADEMGLGKTIQTLAVISHLPKQQGATLIIAPLAVIDNWQRESRLFFAAEEIYCYQGKNRQSEQLANKRIVLTSYGLIKRDKQQLSAINWQFIVLDEAHTIKNSATEIYRALQSFRSQFRLALTGTPIENKATELWSIFSWLMPGFLGSKEYFQQQIRKYQGLLKTPLYQQAQWLILRRTKQEVLTLPEKVETVHRITLQEREQDWYNVLLSYMDTEIQQHFKNQVTVQSKYNDTSFILQLLLQLRLLCVHPSLLKEEYRQHFSTDIRLDSSYVSSKNKYLLQLLQRLKSEQKHIIVFSQFAKMITLLGQQLVDFGWQVLVITGATKQRQRVLDQFAENPQTILLISIKAGGTGLNITAADTVIHYDPWWNPALEQQANDRAHRLGQTKKVTIHKLLIANSIEEKIHKLQLLKGDLAAKILNNSQQLQQFFFTTDKQ